MIKLNNFQIQEQKKSYTCGYSSLSMISCFLGNKVEEDELEKVLPIGLLGITPSKFITLFKRHLPSYIVKFKFIHKNKFIEQIECQLEGGIPVPFICLAKNKFGNPKLVSHYLVIIGLDKLNSKFYIADPFDGCEKEISFEEAYNEMAFSDASMDKTIIIYKVVRMLVKLKGFMVFIIRKNNIPIN